MKKQQGFTLIELMVVMAIIAILATAGLAAYTDYIKKARDATRISMAYQIDIAVNSLMGSNGGILPNYQALRAYLKTLNMTYSAPEISSAPHFQESNYLSTLSDTFINFFGASPLFGYSQKPYSSSFYISKLRDGFSEKVFTQPFSTRFSTKEFNFTSLKDILTLRIVQTGDMPFAGVDSIKLHACGSDLVPTYATQQDGDKDVLADIVENDRNVIVANDMPIDISWDLPVGCKNAILFLNANEYGRAMPFKFPGNNDLRYGFGTTHKTQTTDGVIDEIKNDTPILIQRLVPSTGHPEGDVYIYASDDADNFYVSMDVTIDNTDDFGQDWTALTIGDKRFLVNDYDSTYGRCAFGLTDKVSYKHQTCEFVIPKNAIGNMKNIGMVLEYYGTAGQTNSAYDSMLKMPAGGKSICIGYDGSGNVEEGRSCNFHYIVYKDNTYVIAYGVEHASSMKSNFYYVFNSDNASEYVQVRGTARYVGTPSVGELGGQNASSDSITSSQMTVVGGVVTNDNASEIDINLSAGLSMDGEPLPQNAGAVCASFSDCNSGDNSYCNINGVCSDNNDEASCTSNEECSTACNINGVCSDNNDGVACTYDNYCTSYMCNGTCEPRLSEGETCDYNINCISWSCVNYQCAPEN